MTLRETKEQMVQFFRMMYHRGMVNLFEGNISVRWGEHYLVTPSQQNKETITADMILEVDADGAVLDGVGRPSSEFKMHREVYRLRPDINACIHSHSTYATAFAVSGKPIVTAGLAEGNVIFGQIPVAAYGRPGTEDIYRQFGELLSEYNTILLENHGVLTVGPDVAMAFSLAEAAEKTAKIVLLSMLLGGEKRLPEEELQQLRGYGSMLRHQGMKQSRKESL